jgi:hypothetical protein
MIPIQGNARQSARGSLLRKNVIPDGERILSQFPIFKTKILNENGWEPGRLLWKQRQYEVSTAKMRTVENSRLKVPKAVPVPMLLYFSDYYDEIISFASSLRSFIQVNGDCVKQRIFLRHRAYRVA